MDINNAFPSSYLKASDLMGRTVAVTIASVVMETVGDDTKPIARFHGAEKGLVLNKTNSTTIASIYGPETDGWAGKPINLYATKVDFRGQMVDAVRVSPPMAPAGVAPPTDHFGGMDTPAAPPPQPQPAPAITAAELPGPLDPPGLPPAGEGDDDIPF